MTFSGYVHGGVQWRPEERLNVGIDLRWIVLSDVDVSRAGGPPVVDTDIDGVILGVTLGWAW